MPNKNKSAAQLFIECLENEGVEYIFGIPGEENLDVMDALLDSRIRFVTTRHEQGAAVMADVYGRLTGKAGVCLATLGPGATNLITGFADANMDRAPIVGIAGQGSTERMHKESHQILDLVSLFRPISKYAAEIVEHDIVPEVVRKAFKDAQAEKPGGSFISFPENIAHAPVSDAEQPLKAQSPTTSHPPPEKTAQAAQVISNAGYPIIMAGNGVVRAGASDALVRFAEKLNIPVTQTFMAKGCIPFSHPLSLGSVGLQAHDYVACGFDRADVVICVGFDMVEYHPRLWHPNRDKKIIHIDQTYAEVDAHYVLECGVVGDIAEALGQIAALAEAHPGEPTRGLREAINQELLDFADDTSFPLKPQRILSDTRKVMGKDDILISDVGAHKMWIARLYAPTILLNPGDDALVSRKEIFGPVICVYQYDDVDDAIHRANDTPFAFQASVMTRNMDTAMYVSERLNGSAIMVNDHTAFRVDWMPFAGLGQSGYGVGGIPYTYRDMHTEKMLVIRSPGR